jgi:hypothetical protein
MDSRRTPSTPSSLWQALFDPLFIRGGDGSNKTVIGPRDGRVCRFCGRDKTATTFHDDAHVIPAAFGNRSLFSNEECDECNQVGSNLEGDLASFLAADRILSRIAARRGKTRQKIKTSDKQRAFGQTNPANNEVYIYQPTDDEGIRMHDDGNGTLTLTVDIPKHQPIKVARAIGRMAFFNLDKAYPGFDLFRQWIRGEVDLYPVPMDFVHVPATSYNLAGISCLRFIKPDRNIVRCGFFYAACAVTIAIPLDGKPLPPPTKFFPLIENEPIPQSLLEHVCHMLISNGSSVETLQKTVRISYERRVVAESE